MFDVPTLYALSFWYFCLKDVKQQPFLKKLFIFNILFFIYIGNFDVFSHVLIFSIKTFISFSDGLTFAKFVEFFLIFQPKDMLDLRNSANLLINIMLIKRRVHLHSTLTQTILVVNYISLLCRLSKCKPFCLRKTDEASFPRPFNITLEIKISRAKKILT